MQFRADGNGRARILCGRRVQTEAMNCQQRSSFVEAIEEQIAAYLGTFPLSEETVRQIITLYEQARGERDDAERRRREITSRLERIAELYKWGDLTREAYQAERDQLQTELAGLRQDSEQSEVLARAAAFLRDLPAAWAQATPEQRNALAALVFESVEIRDDRVTAVVAKPEFAPFFVAAGNQDTPDAPGCQDGESVTIMRKRRDSNPRSQP